MNDLGNSILASACNAETKDLVVDLGELGLDAALEEGVLKEIPVLKSIIACHKTWEAIHDQLFLRKIAGFLFACPRFTDAEKQKFLNEHLNGPQSTTRLSDSIVLVLDRLDDLEKPPMVAQAFAALVRGEIDLGTFRRLTAAVDIGFVEDLKDLVRQTHPTADQMRSLFPCLVRTGLTWIHGPNVPGEGGMARTQYQVSDLGRVFINCMKGTK
jgi:hypothetical protein